ncbi:MAG: hypothetical protein ACWA5A_06860 [Marinibacterium sp.]
MTDLDARLIAAHQAEDSVALVHLYREAAEQAAAEQAAAFFLTQAQVLALEAGLAEAQDLRARLIAMGRDTA